MPASDFHTVQLSMDPASSAAFAKYTAANVGNQLAFVRDGVVLAAPSINTPIDGQSIQISGELSASTAATIATMLRGVLASRMRTTKLRSIFSVSTGSRAR